MRLSPLVVTGACLLSTVACSSVETQTGSTTTTSTTAGNGGSGPGAGGATAATTGSGGTGGAPDIGQPSDTYPAPHPSPPQVDNLGGDVLSAAEIQPILFLSDDATMKSNITDFSSKVAAGMYWNEVTSEYGVGPATSASPVILDEQVASSITDDQIQAWLKGKLEANDTALPTANANSLFIIYYPLGVSISLPDGQGGVSQSCVAGGFGGYHSSFTLDAAHGNTPVAYAVVPRCGTITDVTTAASHELVEAATDAHPLGTPAYGQVDLNHIYWEFALRGGEVGDLCAFGKNADVVLPEIGFATQRIWSNNSIKAGHDPCVPGIANQVYFNAVPVLPDQLNLGGGLNFKGVKIPVGQSKTIDVKLFSDGPTGGPWTVTARDTSMQQGGPQTLDFTFDVDQGQNGQTLHLTIKVLAAGQGNAEIFSIGSTLNNVRNRWYGIVGN